MSGNGPVLAAGAVCWKVGGKGKVKVLLVHRTQHQDVSLPKGKVEPGETLPQTAVREIAEETGLIVALGAPLGTIRYPLANGRDKVVHYWAAEVASDELARSTFVSNQEIERLEWVGLERARRILSYPHDVDVVNRFAALHEAGRARTFALILLRHGKAVPAYDWDGPDAERPLQKRGERQARGAADGIAAYRPVKLLSSDAVRCLRTIEPTSRVTRLPVKRHPAISQDAYTASGAEVARVVEKRLRRGVTAVLCSHGPVLPQLADEIARQTGSRDVPGLADAGRLQTGQFAVVHLPAGGPGGVIAVEVHGPTD